MGEGWIVSHEAREPGVPALRGEKGFVSVYKIIQTASDTPMDLEKTISEIELLERIFALPDARGFTPADREAANRRWLA